jgi:hypothetical protein
MSRTFPFRGAHQFGRWRCFVGLRILLRKKKRHFPFTEWDPQTSVH